MHLLELARVAIWKIAAAIDPCGACLQKDFRYSCYSSNYLIKRSRISSSSINFNCSGRVAATTSILASLFRATLWTRETDGKAGKIREMPNR